MFSSIIFLPTLLLYSIIRSANTPESISNLSLDMGTERQKLNFQELKLNFNMPFKKSIMTAT